MTASDRHATLQKPLHEGGRPYMTDVTFRDRRLYRAGQFFQSHFGRPRRCRPAVSRGNDRALFLHRLRRRLPRHTPIRHHAGPIRRYLARHRVDTELRHLRARLPNRRRRHHFPAPQHLAAVTPSGGSWPYRRQRTGCRHRRSGRPRRPTCARTWRKSPVRHGLIAYCFRDHRRTRFAVSHKSNATQAAAVHPTIHPF